MIKLIIGNKGAGKTKKLIVLVTVLRLSTASSQVSVQETMMLPIFL